VPAPATIGRYQILQSVGSGGMGSLYLARDPKIGNRRVVIKLLREGFDNPELRERFAREADAAGGLHHINVVTIFDVGEFDGQPFIAMEYIQGETLTDMIQRGAKLSMSRKLQMMEELCAGLHYAHRAGVVHRDIKPANVMVDEDGVVKILDFGIARLGSSGMTQAGMVMGTLNYMAPEQMAGQQVDHRADIFSAGALFYELLSYRRAFPGELPGIVHKIMTASREPLMTLVPDLDPGIAAVVDRCLAREPGDRYPDMAAARRDLAAIRQRILAAEQNELRACMADADLAMGRADFPAAIQACERVLVLDSDYGPALELQQRARAALETTDAQQWLTEARRNLEAGALTAASLLADRAIAATGSPDAVSMRQAIDDARCQMAAAQEQHAALAAIIARAEQQLADGALDAARASVDEALGADAGHLPARALKERIVAAAHKAEEEARARAEHERLARATVDAARQRFAAGSHAEALAALESFAPSHPAVVEVLAELRAEAKELERRRIEAEARQQAEPEGTLRIDLRSLQAEALKGLPPEKTIVIPTRAAVPPASVGDMRHQRPEPAPAATPEVAAGPGTLVRRPAVIGAAAVLALVLGVVAWRGLGTSAPAGPATTTAVVLNVTPWAKIEAITRKADGQAVPTTDLVTPVTVALQPGDYHVRASNPGFSALEFDVTVVSGESQVVRHQMPGFNPEQEAATIAGK